MQSPFPGMDPDTILDLGGAVDTVYERGGYATRIDYQQSPPPPKLSETALSWVNQRLQKA